MADLYIENELIKVGVNYHGAELRNLIRKADGKEYMWCGDSKYWGRVSPVLFPFIGKVNHLRYTHEGKTYENVPQHGYARDCDFVLSSQKEDEIHFELVPDDLFKSRYPFDFKLEIGYKLEGAKVHVLWKVTNTGTEKMPFHIGAHPAYLVPDSGSDHADKNGFLCSLNKDLDKITVGVLNTDGFLTQETKDVALDHGVLTLYNETFDQDALIIDSDDIHLVTLSTPEGKAFLQVGFDCPQLGIWSPVGKKAPFVCIEPWYGRCDRANYEGDLAGREYNNVLAPGEVFDKSYFMEIL